MVEATTSKSGQLFASQAFDVGYEDCCFGVGANVADQCAPQVCVHALRVEDWLLPTYRDSATLVLRGSKGPVQP